MALVHGARQLEARDRDGDGVPNRQDRAPDNPEIVADTARALA